MPGVSEPLAQVYFDPEPLLRLADIVTAEHREADGRGASIDQVLGFDWSVICRWRKAGRIRWDSADRAAVNLGLHPAEIWPTWWEEMDRATAELEERLRRELQHSHAGRRYLARKALLLAGMEHLLEEVG